jgi:hypothetical protein
VDSTFKSVGEIFDLLYYRDFYTTKPIWVRGLAIEITFFIYIFFLIFFGEKSRKVVAFEPICKYTT